MISTTTDWVPAIILIAAGAVLLAGVFLYFLFWVLEVHPDDPVVGHHYPVFGVRTRIAIFVIFWGTLTAGVLYSLTLEPIERAETPVPARTQSDSSGADTAFDVYTTVTGLNDPLRLFQ